MDRPKIVAIITGVISLLLAVGYLVLVQLLDFRGEMVPAPVSQLPVQSPFVSSNAWSDPNTSATLHEYPSPSTDCKPCNGILT
jgi:hypothetical protein